MVCGDEVLTYVQLNARANQLALGLIEKGVCVESVVGVFISRSIDAIVAIYATLKSGAAYLPLDPEHPADRLEYIVEDAKPHLIIVNQDSQKNAPSGAHSLNINDCGTSLDEQGNVKVDNLCERNLAYIIYTSGSTGKPKGVMIEHQSLVNLIEALADEYLYGQHDRVLQFASLTFDMSVEEVFGALGNGSALILRDESWISDVATFWHKCEQFGVTAVNLPTAFWHEVVSDQARPIPASLRQISVGGEQLNPDKVDAWFKRAGHSPRLVNAYGPTEYTVNTSITHELRDNTLSIGQPIQNTAVYLLDNELRPVPFGAVGEICVAGHGIARGYLNQPELTDERFPLNPLNTEFDRIYRTGDLGRYSLDGAIQYYGRDDHQVKIRGFRIELGEIETTIRTLPNVRDCVVIAREDIPGNKTLVAYICLDQETGDISLVKKSLVANLPDYMVPSAFVELPELPLTPNKKVDRKALRKPEYTSASVDSFRDAETQEEALLVNIWAEVFRRDKISADAHFFELGGHSLMSMQVLSRLKTAGYELDVRTFFAQPILSEMAKHLREANHNNDTVDFQKVLQSRVTLSQKEREIIYSKVPGGQANVEGIYPLAPLQEGILFHHMMSKGSDLYVTPMHYSFDSKQQMLSFIEALEQVVQRHQALRTAVMWKELAMPVQVLCQSIPLSVAYEEYASEKELTANATHYLSAEHQWMDLEHAPLVKATCMACEKDGSWSVIIQEHHLISDHISLEIIQEELLAFLEGNEATLPAPAGYESFLHNAIVNTDTHAARQFFTAQMQGFEEITTPFAIDFDSNEISTFEELQLDLDSHLSKAIRQAAVELSVSPAILFHVAWALTLAKVSNSKDVLFGSVLSGRLQGVQEIERVVGLFINTLPLRVDLNQMSVISAVEIVQKQLAELLTFEQIPTAVAEQCADISGGVSLFHSILNYRHSEVDSEDSDVNKRWKASGANLKTVKERTNYPITFSIDDLGQGFSISAQVDQRVNAKTITHYMLNACRTLVDALKENKGQPLLALNIVGSEKEVSALYGDVVSSSSGPVIAELFEQQAKSNASAIAVRFHNEEITYAQLNEQANRLARLLQAKGASANTPIVTLLDRSVELVVSIVAILKSGAGYVPIDTALPNARINMILSDLPDDTIIVTTEAWCGELSLVSRPVVEIDSSDLAATMATLADTNLAMNYSLDDLGYILYTSGSTGKPKAIEMPQRVLANLLVGMERAEPSLHGDSRWLQFSSIGFDLSFEDIFKPLTSGGSVQLIDKHTQLNTALLARVIDEQQIEVLNLPYAALQSLSELCTKQIIHFPALKVVISSAERLRITDSIRTFFAAHTQCQLVNHYGPAETHVVTSLTLDNEPSSWPALPSIGQPIQNVQLYVLDEFEQPVPKGAQGELYIAGECLSNGYYQSEDLTSERFIKCDWVENGRMYKTGDIVQINNDSGELVYFGRDDHQVKIRGFRIELGDIETQLSKITGITSCVAVAHCNDSPEPQLVVYFTSEISQELKLLKQQLSSVLPDYMVPNAFVHVEAMPINANGKVDRKQLPAPSEKDFIRAEYCAPQSDLEKQVCEIWQQILNMEQVGLEDNFFDLGGHSLLAMKLISRVEQEYRIALPIAVIFEQPELRALCHWIEKETVIQRNKHIEDVVEEYDEVEW
ncbi:hypothetical protein PULV_a4233 [Pseudoalteromonas ulvae UL12]|nr:hypothetical protein [Pseudoalteromonas ulvae UL12]